MEKTIISKGRSNFLRVAQASVYTPDKGDYKGIEVLGLTFLNYKDKIFTTLPLTLAKKHFKFITNTDPQSLAQYNRPVIEMGTTFSIDL